MPQDLNQGIFPELAGNGDVLSASYFTGIDNVPAEGQEGMDASLPEDLHGPSILDMEDTAADLRVDNVPVEGQQGMDASLPEEIPRPSYVQMKHTTTDLSKVFLTMIDQGLQPGPGLGQKICSARTRLSKRSYQLDSCGGKESPSSQITRYKSLCRGAENSSYISLAGNQLDGETETDMGYSSHESPTEIVAGEGSLLDRESETSGQFSQSDDMLQRSRDQTQDLLFHFDRFFRNRFEAELEQFRESMEDMFSEQQIHLKRIMLKSEPEEVISDDISESQNILGDPAVTNVIDDSLDTVPEEAGQSIHSPESADASSKSVFLIRMFTATCCLITRLQSPAFRL